ncbi:hypothetical protein CEXT_407311 [Caerostris extrusa]|uniref:Uncharacterized protein n=1 Tax=Caerostris extrusa TaxID=172846 RepID=A0AAV4T723_CAEEX|nr:hypothetical protein CEXT_407311 [Caerostris extrusa]
MFLGPLKIPGNKCAFMNSIRQTPVLHISEFGGQLTDFSDISFPTFDDTSITVCPNENCLKPRPRISVFPQITITGRGDIKKRSTGNVKEKQATLWNNRFTFLQLEEKDMKEVNPTPLSPFYHPVGLKWEKTESSLFLSCFLLFRALWL